MSAVAAEKPIAGRIGDIEVKPLQYALGAEVVCGDVRRLDPASARTVREAWLDHLVLLFRGQTLSDDELVAFAQTFGKLSRPITEKQRAVQVEGFKHPHISVISNVIENGVPIGNLGDGEAFWHTDFSFEEVPYAATLLYSLEIPADGSGNTGFSNMYRAYETLPADLRERVAGMTIKHDASHNSAGILRRGCNETDDVREVPGPSHPIVRTHPETKRNCLYLGRRAYAYVNGLSVAESEDLLNLLWAHAEKPEFQWHHEWKVGDLLVWDNRCTMHHRDAFDPASRRVMHKTMTEGDRPSFQAAQ
jgi:taurine dioxygenase